MRIRRGCGCPLLILVVADLFLVVGAIISLASGPSDTPIKPTVLGSTFSLIVMIGNSIACIILAIAALRGRTVGEAADEMPAVDGDVHEGEDVEDREDQGGT